MIKRACEMNLFYQLLLSFAIFIFNVTIYRLFNSIDTRVDNHTRIKRVYNGLDVADDKFPYIVFLKTVFNLNDTGTLSCYEMKCTGTLIHRRYVLTILDCCSNSSKHTEIKIFLKTRPYDEIENMTYNIGILIEQKPTKGYDKLDHDNVAIILMNDTFPGVTAFPNILPVDPIPEGTKLSCSTVGFSLIGRNISRPIVNPIKPTSYDFEAEFNITKCNFKDHSMYLCYSGPKTLDKTLCDGDRGSPLLCKHHGGGGGGLYVYGLADKVSKCNGQDPLGDVMFLYMLKYGAWISNVLEKFDEEERLANATTTMSTNGTTSKSTQVTSSLDSTSTQLPEYYDTKYYDEIAKTPMRCKTGICPQRSRRRRRRRRLSFDNGLFIN